MVIDYQRYVTIQPAANGYILGFVLFAIIAIVVFACLDYYDRN